MIAVVWNKIGRMAIAAWVIVAACALASGQVVKSPAGAISLSASLPESITLSLSASGVNFTLLPGKASNPGSGSVTATTNWIFSSNRNVTLYAYFSSSTAALTDGAGHNIPSSAFQISNNGGGWQSLTSTVLFGGAGAGLSLGRVRANGNNRSGSRTDVMNFNINLSGGTLPQLPAATYTGTLTLQVQAL